MENVLSYLKDNEAKFIGQLCDYVRFPSVSAQPQHAEDMKACSKWLLEHCRGIGLEAELHPTAGNPILVARTPRRKGRKHFLVYGHYDVQPAEPLELWKSPPFEPRIEGHRLYGRGASDNKGQHFAHLKAVEAHLKTRTPLPCDLTFVLEGEEEVGSKNFGTFLKTHRRELACDAVVISDSGIPSLKEPVLVYALRGLVSVEIILSGPSRDLHSGMYGGTVDNPAMVLCQMLAQLRDERGRIAIPGFYKDVVPLSASERRQMARLSFSRQAYQKFLGVPKLFGEKGYTTPEQRAARPTLEINGLTSGYQGPGDKTVIPAVASAKLTMRIVPNQQPAKVLRLVREHLQRVCPPTTRLEIISRQGADAFSISPHGKYSLRAIRALRRTFGREPLLLREGATIPVANDLKRLVSDEVLLLGFGLLTDNAHSPNEKFDLACFFKGMTLGALLWTELTTA